MQAASVVLAKPLWQRAIVILEKTLGFEHPDLTSPLNILALLYVEAEEIEARAQAIRAKRAQEIPQR